MLIWIKTLEKDWEGKSRDFKDIRQLKETYWKLNTLWRCLPGSGTWRYVQSFMKPQRRCYLPTYLHIFPLSFLPSFFPPSLLPFFLRVRLSRGRDISTQSIERLRTEKAHVRGAFSASDSMTHMGNCEHSGDAEAKNSRQEVVSTVDTELGWPRESFAGHAKRFGLFCPGQTGSLRQTWDRVVTRPE